ncbi:MAG: YraN family protein [Owenweeksia sp.]
MADHNTLGERGEQEAVKYLEEKGYSILERNWRFRHEEIDIIAEAGDHIAIVEVKARTNRNYGSPSEFVSLTKQAHLIKAANAFADQYNVTKDIRFDVISIVFKPDFSLEHICEAFYP